MAKKIVEVAKYKHMQTVAEFCSNADVENKAILLEVDYVQGYHIGKPAKSIVSDYNDVAIQA